ncbi:Enterobactin exporter EntS [Neolewinella maritima]|uniref:Enterobactin exporter EntS n=1 Tax=Neolewinella maritima TaxID=1383882 RepID=A0ABN8F2H3_9BACT|nr:MFS transporter [Neolewinella maritima]CAH0998893.1 Enterobactin exporter EntS [Neolewinella maritima]
MPDQKATPLKNTYFLLFVFATFVSNVGTWLFAIAAGWLMTDLGSSALSVSLVQTAALLPMLLLAVPAGTVGDLFDRRRVVIYSQLFLIVNTLTFAYLVYLELASVNLLLLFTLLNGAGAAFARPVLSAIIPQLVERDELRTAMAAASISFNLSRAVGPVLAGILIARFSIDLPFWIDGLSFAAVVAVIYFWRQDKDEADTLPREPLGLAMMDSIRFLRYTPALYNSVLRSLVFFVSAGALWALLPLVAKERLGGGADLYGYLVGAAGLGAVVAGLVSNWLTDRFGSNHLTVAVSIVLGVGLAALGYTTRTEIALAAAFVCGMCWQSAFTSLITSAQYALPKWFGARGMAYFIMAMSGAIALGSAVWGWLADVTSIEMAHYLAAGTGAILAPLGLRFQLDQAEQADLRAVSDTTCIPPEDEQHSGWVMTRIHYRLGQADPREAAGRIQSLKPKRYRAGALRWGLYREAGRQDELIEAFMEASWSQLQRHARHVTREDEGQVRAFEEWLRAQGGSVERQLLEEVR